MDAVCLGLMVYDILVKPVTKDSLDKEFSRVDFIKTSTGGDAFNVACGLSKIGVRVSLMGKVGDDRTGKLLRDMAALKGINTESIIVSKEYGTGTSVLLVHPDAQRSSLLYTGSNDSLCEEDIDYEKIRNAKVLAVGSALALKGLDGEGLKNVLKHTQEMGVTTVVDVTGNLNPGSLEIIKSYLPYIDIFAPNLKESIGMTGKEKPEEIALEFMRYGVNTVVIKMGIEGCYIRTKDEEFKIPAFKVEAVDTTGAGDSFIAGFIAAYIKGWSLYECGRFANAVGALSVQQVGASEGVKPMKEVLEFIESFV